MRNKFLLLGAGELGKEFTIAAQRLGQHVLAADRYANAPAMQVAQASAVINMLDGEALDQLVEEYQPDFIVPEIEAIRTERFYDYEQKGIRVVPSAKAANYTMNRKAIRDLAAKELDIRTANYAYAKNEEELKRSVEQCGIPCVIKPLMSSSGKGQSVIRSAADISQAWNNAIEGSRGDQHEVIVEEFIEFEKEITLLTVTQYEGRTLFCPPIGHRQEGGDYRESWQPADCSPELLKEAEAMAEQVTSALGGAGIWGVEFFLTKDLVYFSELSPRPHDTGMVTLAGTQPLNEFELHLRAILGLPIPEIELLQMGVSVAVLAEQEATNFRIDGVDDAMNIADDVRLFGKPTTRPGRRMGVVLNAASPDHSLILLIRETIEAAKKIRIAAD